MTHPIPIGWTVNLCARAAQPRGRKAPPITPWSEQQQQQRPHQTMAVSCRLLHSFGSSHFHFQCNSTVSRVYRLFPSFSHPTKPCLRPTLFIFIFQWPVGPTAKARIFAVALAIGRARNGGDRWLAVASFAVQCCKCTVLFCGESGISFILMEFCIFCGCSFSK